MDPTSGPVDLNGGSGWKVQQKTFVKATAKTIETTF